MEFVRNVGGIDLVTGIMGLIGGGRSSESCLGIFMVRYMMVFMLASRHGWGGVCHSHTIQHSVCHILKDNATEIFVIKLSNLLLH
jgi:hypothetical protein